MVSDSGHGAEPLSREPVIGRACALLLERLRGELAPAVPGAEDAVQLAYPGMEADYRLGVFPYDMEEIRPFGPPGEERIRDSAMRSPCRLLALHLLLYANRRVPFDGMEGMDELLLLEGAARAAQDMAPLEVDGQQVRVGFLHLEPGEKTALWQSLGQPLQPAVYLTLEPLRLPGGRLRPIHPVKEARLSARRKEGGSA